LRKISGRLLACTERPTGAAAPELSDLSTEPLLAVAATQSWRRHALAAAWPGPSQLAARLHCPLCRRQLPRSLARQPLAPCSTLSEIVQLLCPDELRQRKLQLQQEKHQQQQEQRQHGGEVLAREQQTGAASRDGGGGRLARWLRGTLEGLALHLGADLSRVLDCLLMVGFIGTYSVAVAASLRVILLAGCEAVRWQLAAARWLGVTRAMRGMLLTMYDVLVSRRSKRLGQRSGVACWGAARRGGSSGLIDWLVHRRRSGPAAAATALPLARLVQALRLGLGQASWPGDTGEGHQRRGWGSWRDGGRGGSRGDERSGSWAVGESVCGGGGFMVRGPGMLLAAAKSGMAASASAFGGVGTRVSYGRGCDAAVEDGARGVGRADRDGLAVRHGWAAARVLTGAVTRATAAGPAGPAADALERNGGRRWRVAGEGAAARERREAIRAPSLWATRRPLNAVSVGA
jgi:hypothetical protein